VTDELSPLSSAATTLRELTDRITATAEERLAAGDEGAAGDLFEVERALRNAGRKLARAMNPRR
jgi:hypothetical protein